MDERTTWVCERCGHQCGQPTDVNDPDRCENCGNPHLESFTADQAFEGEADAFSQNVIDSRIGCFA